MGINSKAVDARERKATQKKMNNEKAAKAAEDALWTDDKELAKKRGRKEEEERKKADLLRRKAENKALLEQEMSSIKTTGKPSIQKVTQAQINAENQRRQKVIEDIYKSNKETVSFKISVFRLSIKLRQESRNCNDTIVHIVYFFVLLKETDKKLVNNEPLIENLNRLDPETIEASGIDDAIKAFRFAFRAYKC